MLPIMKIPHGYRFLPTDQELIVHYLLKKVKREASSSDAVIDCEIYGDDDKEPWKIFDQTSGEKFYVFTKLKKNGKARRVERRAGLGTWKGQRTDLVKDSKNNLLGFKKLFVFQVKDSNSKSIAIKNGHWLMHEFSLPNDECDYVLCEIRNKHPIVNEEPEDFNEGITVEELEEILETEESGRCDDGITVEEKYMDNQEANTDQELRKRGLEVTKDHDEQQAKRMRFSDLIDRDTIMETVATPISTLDSEEAFDFQGFMAEKLKDFEEQLMGDESEDHLLGEKDAGRQMQIMDELLQVLSLVINLRHQHCTTDLIVDFAAGSSYLEFSKRLSFHSDLSTTSLPCFNVIRKVSNFQVCKGTNDETTSTSRLYNNHISFSSGPSSCSRPMSRITEVENESLRVNGPDNGSFGNGNGHFISNLGTDTWNNASLSDLKRARESDGDLFCGLSRSQTQVRKTRISERMRKLQGLFPNIDKQTNTADMLDMAVEYIKDLQKQVKVIPLHLPPGDTSTERTLHIDGISEQIKNARELVDEVTGEGRE
ncbi:hypothetical protein REPUB_Repub13aG0012300 [Reevesia pubescens]